MLGNEMPPSNEPTPSPQKIQVRETHVMRIAKSPYCEIVLIGRDNRFQNMRVGSLGVQSLKTKKFLRFKIF